MKRLLAAILTVTLLGAPPAAGQGGAATSQAATVDDGREAAVDAVMTSMVIDGVTASIVKDETPGAAVLVARDGQVVLEKGYGLANIQTKQAINPDTVFDLASVSKQFTAMAILILRDRGTLSLDDPLTKFFPEFPAYAQKITVRHLLNHTGGLPDYMPLFAARGIPVNGRSGGIEPTSADTTRLLAAQRQPSFPAGERFEYSNSGYVLLGQIVAKATDQPYRQFLRENVFLPLGMTSTIVADDSRPPIVRRAVSYLRTPGGRFDNADYSPLNLIYGDGSINTTVRDMFHWDQALYTEKLVKASTLREAFTPGKTNSGQSTGWGFGWVIGSWHGLPLVHHNGGWAGFRTRISRFPQERFTVVVLSNFGSFDPEAAAHRIAAIYLADKLPRPTRVDRALLETYVGRYELQPDMRLNVSLEGGSLHLQATGQIKGALIPRSEADFEFELNERLRFTFNKDQRGRVVSLTVHSNGDRVARRIQ